MITTVFSQGKAYPLHSGCTDPCDFPTCGKLDCIVVVVGDCIHALPCKQNKIKYKRVSHFSFLKDTTLGTMLRFSAPGREICGPQE